MAPFAHLHVHSCFSFHDGADTPAALVARLPPGSLRVLCLPANGGADALAAIMLGQVLEGEGVEVEA